MELSKATPEIQHFLDTSLNLKPEAKEHCIISPLAGDASTRKYYRVVSDSQSWVLMHWEPFTKKNYPFLSVQEHFLKHEVRVPKVHSISERSGLILLEDLGDLTLERKFWEYRNPENIMPYYKQALDEIIKIHFNSTEDKTDCTAFMASFDFDKLFTEMNLAYENLFEKFLNLKVSAEVKTEVITELQSIATILAGEPKFIAHRDYHSRNIMIKFEKAYVIDFQDARLGSITYDLTSLLKDPYVSISPEMEASLIEYYLENARPFIQKLPTVGKSGSFSIDEFRKIYDIQAVQRCFKAIGTFTMMYNKNKDTRYLKNIVPAVKRVLQSLSNLDKFKGFNSLLIESNVLAVRYDTL